MAPMEEGYRVTSGVDLSRRDAPDNHRQIDQVTVSAQEAFPLEDGFATTWRGARPTLPDSLPMIGEAPRHPGLWLAFGNQHLGFSTGPITGEIVAALVCGETPPVDPRRFGRGDISAECTGRAAPSMLSLVASIPSFSQGSTVEDVDGRDKPDHDGKGVPFIETTSVASDGRACGFLAPQT